MHDFASFVNPGGGYIKGAMAQEEALCSESYLYNVLAEQRDWYGENRRRNINCELYRNRALVVPAVRFERGKTPCVCRRDRCRSSQCAARRNDYHIDDATLDAAMRGRIRFVLACMDALGREKAVLGATDAALFGWDATKVCRDVP